VSAPLDFLRIFAGLLRAEGIPFAITSGMACVHYGLQQTTKDSDWIIPADALPRLVALLERKEGELPPWRVSYRQIFGAPLDAEYMAHGWTSHLSVWDHASSVEHKVDLFSKPPRVRPEEMQTDEEGWAVGHVVAQMKKTDRDKDWPIVNGLGQRLTERGNPLGLLHLTDIPALRLAWQAVRPEAREALAGRRPLLRHLARTPAAGDAELELLLLLERRIWERVNEARHSRYTRAWREFYRRWSKSADFAWPTPEEFWRQQRKLSRAVREHGLPADPLGDVPRESLVAEAVARLTAMRFDAEEVKSLLPPVADLLP
jgi:hypothetical protein